MTEKEVKQCLKVRCLRWEHPHRLDGKLKRNDIKYHSFLMEENWDWFHFSELCLTERLVLSCLNPAPSLHWPCNMRSSLKRRFSASPFFEEASNLGSPLPDVRIPPLDKKDRDVKYVCCPSSSHLWFEENQKRLFGDADSLRYPASLTS